MSPAVSPKSYSNRPWVSVGHDDGSTASSRTPASGTKGNAMPPRVDRRRIVRWPRRATAPPHLPRYVDPRLPRHLLADQRHREQRSEVVGTDGLAGARVQRRLRRRREVWDDVEPCAGNPVRGSVHRDMTAGWRRSSRAARNRATRGHETGDSRAIERATRGPSRERRCAADRGSVGRCTAWRTDGVHGQERSQAVLPRRWPWRRYWRDAPPAPARPDPSRPFRLLRRPRPPRACSTPRRSAPPPA